MDAFLHYSMTHARRIRVILLIENRMTQQNILVVRYTEEDFTYTSAKQKTPLTLPRGSLLSAGYARGDTGESE